MSFSKQKCLFVDLGAHTQAHPCRGLGNHTEIPNSFARSSVDCCLLLQRHLWHVVQDELGNDTPDSSSMGELLFHTVKDTLKVSIAKFSSRPCVTA